MVLSVTEVRVAKSPLYTVRGDVKLEALPRGLG